MVVIDSSALIEFLLNPDAFPRITEIVRTRKLHAPHLIDIEVVHSMRHAVFGRRLAVEQAEAIIADFRALRIARYPHTDLLQRMWKLRHNASAYDASYVALAEMLEVPLITRDRALANSSSHAARIEYIA